MTNAPEFEKFWAAWPRNQGRYSRKGGKTACLAVWNKRYHFTQAETIIKHVEWLKATSDWLKDDGAFIPAPLVYLNQQRWDGADIPDKEEVHVNPEIVRTQEYLQERATRVPAANPDRVREMLEKARASITRGKT